MEEVEGGGRDWVWAAWEKRECGDGTYHRMGMGIRYSMGVGMCYRTGVEKWHKWNGRGNWV